MAIDPLTGMAIGQAAGGIVGGIKSLFGGDDPARDEFLQALDLIRQVQDPNFDFTQLTAPELMYIAEIDPETYEARVPQEVKTIAESEARGNQMLALRGLEDIAVTGEPLADRLATQDVVESLAAEAGGEQEAILQDLAARGRLGAGTEVQARMEGGRNLNSLRAALGRQLAQERLGRRAGALESAGALAGDIRSSDLIREAQNADWINRMNQYISQQETEADRFRAEQETANRVREAEGRQRVSDVNRLGRYDVAAENLNRFNTLQQALQDFRMRRAQGQTGILGDLGTSDRLTRAAEERNLQNITSGAGGLLGALYGSGALKGSSTMATAPVTQSSAVEEEDPYEAYKRIRGF